MESGVVRRRANIIAAHLASHEDLSATATHVFPMSCSNILNTVIRRCDNRTNFARQGSSSQGPFMRQASTKQGTYTLPESICGDKEYSNAFDAPMFSRPAQVEPGITRIDEMPSVVQGSKYVDPAADAHVFAKPSQKCGNPQIQCQKMTPEFASDGHTWSPRMDVAESGYHYFVTLEIPGVSIDNVNVEVHDQSLVVTGNRPSWSCGASSCLIKSASSYHKKEIKQGPYRIVWPLPSNANRENVSAEIQDGLLRITVPKLSGLRWLMKAHM